MKFTEKKQKLEYLLQMIILESTGTSNEMSEKICVSKRTLFRYIDELRQLGYHVGYCFQRNTYYMIKPHYKNKEA